MDIRQLEYFLAVCERGSINKAAACLYTTQPNVSKVIASFEAELGRELFKRSHRGMQLTPYGNTIRQYAESVLKHIKLIMDAAGLRPAINFLWQLTAAMLWQSFW